MRSYFANGKVMLCGEYSVTTGVEALALPVKVGQWLKVWEMPTHGNSKIYWQSKEIDGSAWFECRIDPDIMHVYETTDEEVSKTLVHLLREIKSHRPELFEHKTIRVETELEFKREWGLGSSSTLVSNLATWSGINAFALQEAGFGGSGYDVAVGITGKPLVYWLENNVPNWSPWSLDPQLTDQWHIAFTGNKQNSRSALADVQEKLTHLASEPTVVQQLNACIQAIKQAKNVAILEAMLEMWQALLAQLLDLPRTYDTLEIEPVQGGLCKWLGAWGGDMLLVNEKILTEYGTKFEATNIIPWNLFVIN